MTAGQILRFVRSGEGVVSISTFEGGKAESIEILITEQSPVAGKQLKDIRLPGKALVGVILRGDDAIVPRGNTELLVGDHIVPVSYTHLKVLADVGLLGYPSVGKSSILRKVSKAQPEVAAYHFTTLTPVLGVVTLPGDRSFVLADIPGLIEGASEGVGLGHNFLRQDVYKRQDSSIGAIMKKFLIFIVLLIIVCVVGAQFVVPKYMESIVEDELNQSLKPSS